MHLSDISEEWLDKLFDGRQVSITTPYTIYKDKLQCECYFDDRVPAAKIQFLLDQKSERKLILSSVRDMVYTQTLTKIFKHTNKTQFH